MSNFRSALKSDAQVLLEIVNQEYAESEKDLILSSFPRISIEKLIELIEHRCIFTLELQGSLVCSFCLKTSSEEAELSMMAVTKIHQGKGLGRQIVEYSIQCANERKAKTLSVEVLQPQFGPVPAHQAKLLQWYQRLGFRKIAVVDYESLAKERRDSQKIPCSFFCMKKDLD
jgi:GNAT superfamily N-acetyltransferase